MKKTPRSRPLKTLNKGNLSDDSSRRTFVKNVAALGVLSTTTSLSRETNSESTTQSKYARHSSQTDCDVAIIGAGLAGLIAARELKQQGFTCQILEARNRLGGRVFTTKFAGHKVELGGNWTFWGNPHMWAEITRYGLNLDSDLGTSAPEEVYWITDGKLKKGDYGALDSILRGPINEFFRDAWGVYPNPYDPLLSKAQAEADTLSVQDGIDRKNLNQEEQDLVASFFGAVCSNFNTNVSLLQALHWFRLHSDYNSYGNAMMYKIREGTTALVDAIVADARAEISLGTPVISVKQESQQAVLTTDTGATISARAVLIAVPVNTLDDIEFSPPLMPQKTEMAKQRHGGSGVKFYARIKGSLPPLMAFAADTAPASMIFTVDNLEDSAIVCGLGPSPKLLDLNDDKQMQAAIRQWLPQAEVLESFGYDWNLDPYSQGMWCAFRPTQITNYLSALQQSENRLFFAGGDIANGFRGFMDGAVESGLRAARELAESLS